MNNCLIEPMSNTEFDELAAHHIKTTLRWGGRTELSELRSIVMDLNQHCRIKELFKEDSEFDKHNEQVTRILNLHSQLQTKFINIKNEEVSHLGKIIWLRITQRLEISLDGNNDHLYING